VPTIQASGFKSGCSPSGIVKTIICFYLTLKSG